MPLFDFRCRACGHTFEALVRLDLAPTECPECAGELERLPSVFASTSREQRQAAASKQVASAAKQGRAETAAQDRDTDAHRKEEH
ncbi:MAG: zinc ribbon domain-containing protein [Acidobacteriota bacterium]